MSKARRVIPILAAMFACSGEVPSDPDGGSNCTIHDQPTFELGTGAEHFEPLVDEQVLRMAPGLQGGCHFWLAVRTDGFADRRFQIAYELFFADTGTTSGSTSSQRVRLLPAEGQPGKCEYAGYTAFILDPPVMVGRRIRIDVDVTDDLGRSAGATRVVVGEWPEANPDLCRVR